MANIIAPWKMVQTAKTTCIRSLFERETQLWREVRYGIEIVPA